jgi:hypothetical protein
VVNKIALEISNKIVNQHPLWEDTLIFNVQIAQMEIERDSLLRR